MIVSFTSPTDSVDVDDRRLTDRQPDVGLLEPLESLEFRHDPVATRVAGAARDTVRLRW